jgi:hypothetical protein
MVAVVGYFFGCEVVVIVIKRVVDERTTGVQVGKRWRLRQERNCRRLA